MLQIEIPGRQTLILEHLVSDFNGTLSRDGALLPGVAALLADVARVLRVHIVTAGTHGGVAVARAQLEATVAARADTSPVIWEMVGAGDEKAAYVSTLGADRVVAVGNGANDALMFRCAALALAVVGPEGLAREALETADALFPSIEALLGAMLAPDRLKATLRR